jgi:hypothetical protein
MALTIQRETTEFSYMGVSGDPPSVGAEVAFLDAGVRPTDEWEDGTLVLNDSDPLWADAVASGATGDYFVARLIGSFGGNELVLGPGTYQPWLRLTDTVERPVRIGPETLIVQ